MIVTKQLCSLLKLQVFEKFLILEFEIGNSIKHVWLIAVKTNSMTPLGLLLLCMLLDYVAPSQSYNIPVKTCLSTSSFILVLLYI
jgi:hypothetical protein